MIAKIIRGKRYVNFIQYFTKEKVVTIDTKAKWFDLISYDVSNHTGVISVHLNHSLDGRYSKNLRIDIELKPSTKRETNFFKDSFILQVSQRYGLTLAIHPRMDIDSNVDLLYTI